MESRTSIQRKGSVATFSKEPRASLREPASSTLIHSYATLEPFRPVPSHSSFAVAKLARIPNNTPPTQVIGSHTDPAIIVCPKNYYADHRESRSTLRGLAPSGSTSTLRWAPRRVDEALIHAAKGKAHRKQADAPHLGTSHSTPSLGNHRSFMGGGTVRIHMANWHRFVK
jgi:hypothetical protein